MASGRGIGHGGGRGGGVGSACLLCIILLFTILLALLGLIGLCLAIWQTVDALHTNKDLMALARHAVLDERLIKAVYIFLAFVTASVFLGCLGRRRNDADEADESSGTTCMRHIFNLLLLSGFLACGIMAALYRSQSIPAMETGLQTLLVKSQYLDPQQSKLTPVYTQVGGYFNFLQSKYHCCGVSLEDGADYQAADFTARYNLTVPYSCCTLKNKKVNHRSINFDDVANYTKCSSFDPSYFHKDTCHAVEEGWLRFKTNFLMGYNFTLVSISGVCFLLLTFLLVAPYCA